MTPAQQDLLIAEYNALRAENLQRIDHLASQTRNILVITGALWAWLLSEGTQVVTIAYWIPLIISALLFLNNRLTIATIRRVSAYLKDVTTHVALPAGLGWEQYLKDNPLGLLNKWGNIFWAVLLVGNTLLPIYLIFFARR
jgi:hypothetical protein